MMKPIAKSDNMNSAKINIIATSTGDGLYFGFHAPHNKSETITTARYHTSFSSYDSNISFQNSKSMNC